MTGTSTTLYDALRVDFVLACADLAEARRRAGGEDLCRGVVEASSRIDATLDMHLQAVGSVPSRPSRPTQPGASLTVG